jgi:hypothetical protein
VNTPCRIIDMSIAGCMVEARRLPTGMERRSVWVRPAGVTTGESSEGIIISVRKPFFRNCRVGIAFLAPFPYEAFKALVYGPDQEIADRELPEHEKDWFWK